jgi:hypothetical protein
MLRDTFDLTSSSFPVQTLGIPLLQDRKRSIDEYFNKSQTSLAVELTGMCTVCPVGRNEGRESDTTRIREEFRDLWSNDRIYQNTAI